MKAIAILIVLAGTVLCIQAALPNIGTCTYESYNNKIRTCMTMFIKGLQQNPKDDCSVHLDSFLNCSAVAVHACIPLVSVEDMRKAMKPQLTEELMCKRAGLQYPDPSTLNVTFPCNITTSEYITKNNDCAESLVKKWSANRADPTICSEYNNVKKCMKNTIDKHCQFVGDLLELAKYQFDDYNPFCPNNVDPTNSNLTSTSLTSTNLTSTTSPTSKVSSTPFSKDSNGVDPDSKVSSIMVSEAAIIISLVVAAIQAF